MVMHAMDTKRATCECGYTGTLAQLELHDCGRERDLQEYGRRGRCEDYPCCGHTDGLGCGVVVEATSDYYLRNPIMLYEPGSPEWYDEMERAGEYDGDEDD